MADETTVIDEWIATTLLADGSLTALVGSHIYSELVPQGAAFPAVVFSQQSAVDVLGAGQQRIMVDGLWLVRGIVQAASYSGTLSAIANRIDALLDANVGFDNQAATARVLASTRVQPFRLAEQSNGLQYRHLGGMYRIYSQAV